MSHFYANAALYDAPAPVVPGTKRHGRPRPKGPKLPAPAAVVARPARPQRRHVTGYGGGRRAVAVVTGTGPWHRSGAGLVPVRRVWVHDGTGTHRDEYFFTTAVGWTAAQVIETDTGRWNIETTFEEMRSCFGLETTRDWTERTVLRVALLSVRPVHGGGPWYVPLPAWRRAGAVVAWLGQHDVAVGGRMD